MKVFGWMHRKLMQNNMETWKNPTTGNGSSLAMLAKSEEQNYYMAEPTTKLSKFNKSSNHYEATKFEESFEAFDFLSIGTFGFELLRPEPPTPTLAPTTVNITENDLDLISHELEKFLDAQETSEFSSDVAISRHIHMAANSPNSCPLQNYLLAASVEQVETTEKEATKRERASLGELFKRNDNLMEKRPQGSQEKHQVKPRKNDNINVAHFMKKVVNKFNSSSNPTNKNKLSKSVAKMLKKKVYPEEMTAENPLLKHRNKIISIHEDEDINTNNKQLHQTQIKRAAKKKSSTIKLSWVGICKGASPLNSEHWIKTDSDYLVLEL